MKQILTIFALLISTTLHAQYQQEKLRTEGWKWTSILTRRLRWLS